MGDVELHIRDDSTVHFHPLTVLPPRDSSGEWIVGHEPSDTAISLPKPGIVAIQQLQSGATVAEAHAATLEGCGEDVDVAELVAGLVEIGFVTEVDAYHVIGDTHIGQRWLAHIPPRAVAWLYSPPLLILYVTIAITGPVLLLLNSAIRPQAHDLLWSTSYSVDTITLVLLAPLLLLKHELGHLLAGRRKGLAADLNFGHRFIYLVVVSRVAAVWKLRRRERLLIYSAGMLNDLVFAGVGLLILFAAQEHLLSLSAQLSGLIALLVLSEYLGVAWEFQIFLKTDVYHIVADITGRHDLPEQARAVLVSLRNRALSLLHFQGATPEKPEATRNRADWLTVGYTLLAAIGFGATLIWFLAYMLPATFMAIGGETTQLVTGLSSGHVMAALDGAVALASQCVFFALLTWSWMRERQAQQRRVIQPIEIETQPA